MKKDGFNVKLLYYKNFQGLYVGFNNNMVLINGLGQI